MEIQSLQDKIASNNLEQRVKDLKDKESELKKVQDQINKTLKSMDDQKQQITNNQTDIEENKKKQALLENVLIDRKRSEQNQTQILNNLKEVQTKFSQP